MSNCPATNAPANENLARLLWINGAVVNPSPRIHHQPVQGNTLERSDLRRLALPVRVIVLALHEVRAHLLDPLRLDAGDVPRIEARGLDQLRRHQPFRLLLLHA